MLALLYARAPSQIIEMMNGCICCTVREDLIATLSKLAKERAGQFDHVVIETTGLADPAPVAQTFFVDKDVSTHYRLDAIITFVDAKHCCGKCGTTLPCHSATYSSYSSSSTSSSSCCSCCSCCGSGHLAEVKPDGVENESVEQIAFADVLVINKVDLVTGMCVYCG
jgi:G3E family GTPase